MRKAELVRGKNTLCLNQSSLCVRAADMDFPMRRFRSPNSSSNRPQKKKEIYLAFCLRLGGRKWEANWGF